MDRLTESSLRIRAAMSSTRRRRVLVAGADHGLRHLLAAMLKLKDLEVLEADADIASLEQVARMPGTRRTRRIDMAFLDARKDPATALETLEHLCGTGDDTRVLVIASAGDEPTGAAAVERGAAGVLHPPVTAARITEIVEQLMP